MKFIIKDWIGKICFEGKEFDTFEEGDAYIDNFIDGELLNVDDLDDKERSEIRGEYYVTFDHYEVLDEVNYFDQAEAAYTVCVLWHGGQSSLLYELQCRIDFKPGHGWSESDIEKNSEFYPEFFDSDGKPDEKKLELFVEELEHYFDNREE